MYIKWNWKLILQVRHTVSLGLQLESIFHISPNRTIQMPFDVCRWVLRASKSLSTLATLSKRWHVWCRHPEWTGELSVQMSHRILGESLRDQRGDGVQRIAMPQQWQMCSQVAARVRVQMSRRILWWVLAALADFCADNKIWHFSTQILTFFLFLFLLRSTEPAYPTTPVATIHPSCRQELREGESVLIIAMREWRHMFSDGKWISLQMCLPHRL